MMFHKFNGKFFSEDFDSRIIAASAAYLAYKNTAYIDSRLFINYLWEKLISDYQIDTKVLTKETVKRNFYEIESKMLEIINFDLSYESPRTYLLKFNEIYKDPLKSLLKLHPSSKQIQFPEDPPCPLGTS